MTNWKMKLAAVMLIAAMVTSAVPAYAETAAPAAPAAVGSYTLTDSIQAAVMGLAVSKTSAGTLIGAVIRLHNNANKMNRVPDYEVRVKLADGSQYTLAASSVNARSVLAMENTELTYLATVDRQDEVVLTELSLVEVDEYTYPKTETTLLTLPATAVWNAAKSEITDPAANKAWGDSFTIPASLSPVRFTPAELSEQNDAKEGHSYVVTLLAENTGTINEALPDFRLDGKAGDQIYTGKRVEASPIILAPGEKKYIHIAIPAENNVKLHNLLLITTENFVPAGAAAGSAGATAGSTGAAGGSTFDVGRLSIAVPEAAETSIDSLPNYAIGTPVSFDPLNKIIDQGTTVSLMELHMHENEGQGFKSVVAKFKLHHTGSLTVALPAFQAQLIGSDGSSYTGSRQSAAAANLMPNLSYVVSYSFMVPSSENGDHMGIKLLDSQTAAPYGTTIAAFQTAVQSNSDSSLMAFYPFNVQLNDWSLTAFTNGGTGQPLTYSYKIKLNLTVDHAEDVVVDSNFSKFRIELVDGLGRTLGSQEVPFTGENKLISGEQTITIGNLKTEQHEYPLTVQLYEVIDTPNGQAKRLVKTLRQ
ncbi:MAG: hypothetical protein K0S39_592 [Paenibacillus sp.]|jgi:hypothetical protein|nr:hypothetical protein [Paenibacillus sp.]